MNCCGTLGRKVVLTAANSGRLRAAAMNLFMLLGEERHVLAGAILEHEREAAGRADAGNGRRRKRERNALPEAGELLVHALADELILLFSLFVAPPTSFSVTKKNAL